MLRRSTVWWHLISFLKNWSREKWKLSFADRQCHHTIPQNVCQLWLNIQIWRMKDKLGVRIYNVWKCGLYESQGPPVLTQLPTSDFCLWKYPFPAPLRSLLFVAVQWPNPTPVTFISVSILTQPPPLTCIGVSILTEPPPVSVSWPSSTPVPQNIQNQVLFHFVYAVLTVSYSITVCK